MSEKSKATKRARLRKQDNDQERRLNVLSFDLKHDPLSLNIDPLLLRGFVKLGDTVAGYFQLHTLIIARSPFIL
jgi:hypothetical protein